MLAHALVRMTSGLAHALLRMTSVLAYAFLRMRPGLANAFLKNDAARQTERARGTHHGQIVDRTADGDAADVAAWEDDNIHNRLLLERVSLNQILGAVAIALTVVLAGYGVTRLRSARHSTEPGR